MIKQIRILSRQHVKDIINTKGLYFSCVNKVWDLISINDRPSDPLINSDNINILQQLGCRDCLSLCFADITDNNYDQVKKRWFKMGKDLDEIILFDKDMAKSVISFVDRLNREKEDSSLIVHCRAGISRSGAVGTFACDFCGINYDDFKCINPNIFPNYHVLRLLKCHSNMIPLFLRDKE